MRPYTAPLDKDRCTANAATAAGNEGGRCMHRRAKGCKLCGQHAAAAYPKLVEALRSVIPDLTYGTTARWAGAGTEHLRKLLHELGEIA